MKDEVDSKLDGFTVGNSTFIDLQNAGTATTPDITAVLSATGTTDATTFLRGDNTWAVPPTGTDDQLLSLDGGTNVLAIEDGNTVDLTPYLDNTDSQTLSTSGAAGDISISGGNNIALNVDDADADPNNEIQTLTSSDGSVTLTPTGSDYDLSVAIADGSETVVNGGGINVVTGSGTSGDPYVVTGTEVDGDITNEIQDLNLATNTLTITNNASATPIDLSPYLDNTDDQTAAEVSYDGTNSYRYSGGY